jgi:hypothetical protein
LLEAAAEKSLLSETKKRLPEKSTGKTTKKQRRKK